MRALTVCSFALPLLFALHAAAAPTHRHTGPKKLGDFEDWIAATYDRSGHTICYAFTRAEKSEPALPGRGHALLTLTERPAHRDSVAIEAGFHYPPKATVQVAVGNTTLDFYTARSNAFARDDKAAVAAFERGATAVAHSPAPHGKAVTDTFSLAGFTAARSAIQKACPGK